MTEKTVLFDPGYARHTTILSIASDAFYSTLSRFKNFGQKKMKFKMFYSQLCKMVENNVGFCLGCMLWAVYIKSLGDVKIEGNPCLGGTYNHDETVEEADFSIEFFNKFKSDVRYYLGEDYCINPLYIRVLELYKEFLTLNCGFVSTKTTNDVVLPESFKTPSESELEQIYSKIQQVIASGNLIELTEVFEFVCEV